MKLLFPSESIPKPEQRRPKVGERFDAIRFFHGDGKAVCLPCPPGSITGPRVRKPAGVSLKQRFRILARDGFKCQYCGATVDCTQLVVDHRISRKDEGSNEDSNLVTACDPCNSGKGALSIRRSDG